MAKLGANGVVMDETNNGKERFDGQVIIITGANSSQGIGLASAHEFASHGAHAIYLCDFSASHLSSHASSLSASYPDTAFLTRQFDAADEVAVSSVVDDAIRQYGRLDVFFANAGVGGAEMFWKETGKDFEAMMRVNVLSVFVAFREGTRGMRVSGSANPLPLKTGSTVPSVSTSTTIASSAPFKSYTDPPSIKRAPEKRLPSGSLIATASVAGLRSNAGSSSYSASKAAVISLVQTVAYQLRNMSVTLSKDGSQPPLNIRVNAVCPGLIETGMTSLVYAAARKRGTESKIGQLNPMMRGGEAREVAKVVRFLGSGEASYVTGQAWSVDGGLSSGLPFVPGKLA